jgi:hypothetical protein
VVAAAVAEDTRSGARCPPHRQSPDVVHNGRRNACGAPAAAVMFRSPGRTSPPGPRSQHAGQSSACSGRAMRLP